MKKYILFFILAACTSPPTSPKFKKGDCLRGKPDPAEEEWERNFTPIYQVLIVGKRKYKMAYFHMDLGKWYDIDSPFNDFDFIDRTAELVECPVAKR